MNLEEYVKRCVEATASLGMMDASTLKFYEKRLRAKCEWKERIGEGVMLDEEEMRIVLKKSIGDFVDKTLTKFLDLGFVSMSVDAQGEVVYKTTPKGDDYLKNHGLI
jgi:hypothetical protein